jgi:hypothetical protein
MILQDIQRRPEPKKMAGEVTSSLSSRSPLSLPCFQRHPRYSLTLHISHLSITMKLHLPFLITALTSSYASAFSPSKASPLSCTPRARTAPLREKIAEELDLPCEDECALKSFPNLPESVHPGVLSGQAMMDLLNHAKENGECVWP